MAKITPEDFILVNRDGVDYRAKVNDLPSSPDLSEYAKLNDSAQSITAKEFLPEASAEQLANWKVESAYSELDAWGLLYQSTGSQYDDFADGSGDKVTVEREIGINSKGIGIYVDLPDDRRRVTELRNDRFKIAMEDTVGDYIHGLRYEEHGLEVKGRDITVEDGYFVGDGSKLTNLPTGPDINLDEYARLDGATFTGAVTATEFIGDGSKLTNLPVGASLDEANTFNALNTFEGGVRIEKSFCSEVTDINGETVKVDHAPVANGVHAFMVTPQKGTPGKGSFLIQDDGTVAISPDATFRPNVTIDMDGHIKGVSFEGDGSQLTGLYTPTLDEVLASQGSDKVNNNIVLNGSASAHLEVANSNGKEAKITYNSIELSTPLTGKVLIRSYDTNFFPSGGGDTATITLDHDIGSVTATEFIGDGSKLTNLPVADVDAYTKDESNARFLPLDIRNLPELS